MSEIRGNNFTIINKDGKVIAKGDEVQVRHAGSVFLPTNAIPDLERHDWKAEATCTMKLSKRKGRKFSYDIKRLFFKRTPKYISKREILNSIIKDFVDTGIVQMLYPSEHYLCKFSHKQLIELYRELIRLRHRLFEVSPPTLNGEDDKNYFRDPFEIVVPDCGDDKFGVINDNGFESV